MKVYTDTFLPYEFNSKRDVYKFILQRNAEIPKSIILVDIDKEHLTVSCPLSDSILSMEGSEEEIYWLHCQLAQNGWYTKTSD